MNTTGPKMRLFVTTLFTESYGPNDKVIDFKEVL